MARMVADDFHKKTSEGDLRVFTLRERDGRRVRVLSVDGAYESATFLDDPYALPFDYLGMFDLAFCAERPVERALMIGGGAFAWPKHALFEHSELRLDVVERSSEMVQLAREYFELDEALDALADGHERLAIEVGDGRAFLEEAAREHRSYDAILNDAFVGGVAVSNLADEAATGLYHELLAPGGIYLANIIAALEGSASYGLLAAADALKSTFAYVWVVALPDCVPAEPDNLMLVAADTPLELPRARELYA